MSSLFHSLNIGSESLFANRQGINTTSHNIANAHTKGYSRQRVDLTTRVPLERSGIQIGNGTYVQAISRAHNSMVEKQINHVQSQVGDYSSRTSHLENLGGIFSPKLGSSLDKEIGLFFASLQELSREPDQVGARINLQTQGKSLSNAFRKLDEDMQRKRNGINEEIFETTQEITSKLAEIAKINREISSGEAAVDYSSSNDLRDRRNVLIGEISEVINISYYEDRDGMMTIRGPGEVMLVERALASSAGVRKNNDNDGMYDIVITGSDQSSERMITDKISSGRLHGLIQIRDQVITALLAENNLMAKTLVDSFNEIHRQGYGEGEYTKTQGRNFFQPETNLSLAASNMKLDGVIEASYDAISTSSMPDSVGNNVVVNNLIKLQSEKVLNKGRSTLSDYYANYVGTLGSEAKRVEHTKEAGDVILADLKSQRDSISAVSIDEEAANLIRWQTAFTASSKVISTIDEMFTTILGLKR